MSGNVAVKQAEMTLTAQRITVAYTGEVVGGNPQVSQLDAGGVTVVRPAQTARSRYCRLRPQPPPHHHGRQRPADAGPHRPGERRAADDRPRYRPRDDRRIGRIGRRPAGQCGAGPRGRVTGTFSVPDRRFRTSPGANLMHKSCQASPS
ncbi:LptA/OstA family protein [Sphingomonas sp. MMS24-JH45]